MERFDEERPELTGSLISMEFSQFGRISQLWASDPNLAEEGEEFQFVLPPIQFGEELAENYMPGTILLGARTSPDDPWISSRSSVAKQSDDDSSEFDPTSVAFDYEFSLLEDIEATGRFHEEPGLVPQIVWDLTIKNRGRVSIEIGELGLPMAFNNFYDGFGWTDEQLSKLWKSRVYLHKFIGGAASWLFAQRMTAEAPGLLVFPGEGTGWEFSCHVKSSLNTIYQWEGIPVVYVYSKATIEREEWPGWMNEHTSLILEPGDSRKIQTRFVPAESDRQEGLHQVLQACGKPAVRVLPGCVAPIDVGAAVELNGASPKQFFLSRDAQCETDSDENGAFCFIKPEEPGPLHVSFRDGSDSISSVHLMFTEPLRDLIIKRADWITKHQVHDEPGSQLHGAILLTNITAAERVDSASEYVESSGIECSLSDTLYLAEKNTIYPDSEQIEILDRSISEFLLDDVQNPSSHAVSSVLTGPGSAGSYSGRPLGYPHVVGIYQAMHRIAKTYGGTMREETEYLQRAYLTAMAMFDHGWRLYVRTVGVLGFARLYELINDLEEEGMKDEAAALLKQVEFKAAELLKLKFPFAGESVMDTSGMEEVFAATKHFNDDDHLERTVRCAFASRSLAPSWWWYGVDKRCWDGADSTPLRALVDRGEACLAHTTIPTSSIFFGLMDRDYLAVPEAYMRMAFGGMLGPWALVRNDGAASMCYCPDLNSKQAGFNVFTGASGLGYSHYLRTVGAYVLPNKQTGNYIFGCHYDTTEDRHIIRPWDGVGRRVVLRQIGAEFVVSFGCFKEIQLDLRKRWFETIIENPSDKNVVAEITITGLWGSSIEIGGEIFAAENGVVKARFTLEAMSDSSLTGKVIE